MQNFLSFPCIQRHDILSKKHPFIFCKSPGVSMKLGLGPARGESCLQAFIIKLYALFEDPAVLNNHSLPGATSLGKTATHVRNSCHKIRFEWGSKGNLVSFLQLGLIIPFSTRRLLFRLKRRVSFLLGYFPIHLGTLMIQRTPCLNRALMPLSLSLRRCFATLFLHHHEQKLPLDAQITRKSGREPRQVD